MITINCALWRQSALYLLTFALGAAVTFIWFKLASSPLWPTVIAKSSAVAENTASANSWPEFLTVVVMAGLGAIVIALCVRLQTTEPEQRSSPPTSPPSPANATNHWTTAENAEQVEQVRDQVERQLAELVGYVSRYLDKTSDQAAVFAKANTTLAGAGTVEQVQEVINLLIANNANARKNADELRVRLVEAKTESANLEASLRKAETLATVDGLTNLPNRRRFQESLETLIAACHREHTPLCLVLADLDHFKSINDKHGHLAGDAVLKTFANVLSKGVRATDVAARYGGEEFALILPKTPLGSASVVAESLRRAIAETIWVGTSSKQRIGQVTASFGVAEIRDDETTEDLIDRADQKLYEAKRKGRNRVELDHTVTTSDA